MSHKTLTRSELSDSIAREMDIPRPRASELLESVLEEMSQSLIEQGALKLSSFGSFTVRSKNDRIGRNPKTGQEVTIQSRKTISFKASHILRERLASSS